MSLEASYTTEIRIPKTQMKSFEAKIVDSPCMEILGLAMEKAAKDRGGKLDTSYTDNEGKKMDCVLSVRTMDFPNGIGAVIDSDGRVHFSYDAYGDNTGTGRTICDEINQNYNVIAVMRAQKGLGFNVRIEEKKTRSSRKVVTVMGVM